MKQAGEKEDKKDPRSKRVFGNFGEYWHYVRILSEKQRSIIAQSLSKTEQSFLRKSFEKGKWSDLIMRNNCDESLKKIKDKFNVDLLELRMKILSGNPQLVEKAFWNEVQQFFTEVPIEHSAYIFSGIGESDFDKDYVKLYMIE